MFSPKRKQPLASEKVLLSLHLLTNTIFLPTLLIYIKEIISSCFVPVPLAQPCFDSLFIVVYIFQALTSYDHISILSPADFIGKIPLGVIDKVQ